MVPAGRTLTVNGTLTLAGHNVSGDGKVVADNYTFGSSISGNVTIIGDAATVDHDMTIEGNANVSIKGNVTGSAKLIINGKANVTVTGNVAVYVVVNDSASVSVANTTGNGYIENNSTGNVTNGGETVGAYKNEKDTAAKSVKVVK